MPHIVFVSYEIAPTTPGGVGVFVAAAAEALLRDGHRVTLLLDISERDFVQWTDINAVSLEGHTGLVSRRVDALCDDIDADRATFPSEAHWRSYRFAYALAKVQAQAHVDFAEFFDYCGAAYYSLVCRAAVPSRFPARIAIRLHNTIEIIDRRVAANFPPFRVNDYALERAALALADIILSPGQRFWAEECASLYSISTRRVHLSFLPRRPFPRVQGAGEGTDVVFVGRLSTFKGLDRFLHAAVAFLRSELLECLVRRFVVIGPGETVASAQSEQDLLSIADGIPPDRLLFAGRLSENELRQCFAEAAVAVFPNRMESFCYAAHEAHMAGVPLVLSDTPAFRDHFIDGQTALFFDGTVGDLVERLRHILTDIQLRKRLSSSIERHRNRYSKHSYDEHLAIAGFGIQPASTPLPREQLGVIVVPPGNKIGQADRTAEELSRTLPNAKIWILAPTDNGCEVIRAFGRKWRVLDASGRTVPAPTQDLPPTVVFVEGGAVRAGPFLAAAVQMLGNEARIGAVLPARLDAHGICAASEAPVRLEDFHGGLLSAVLRVRGRATLADLLEDGSELSEIAALLRVRARGEILVDHPNLGLAKSADDQSWLSGVRSRLLRRFAWSIDRVLLADALADGAAVAGRLHAIDGSQLGAETAHTPVPEGTFILCVPEDGGSGTPPNATTILNLRRWHAGPLVEWPELRLSGRWREVQVPDRPGALLVGEGGRLEMSGSIDPELTLLLGPDQGVALLALGSRAVRLELNHSSFWQISVRLSELFALCSASDELNPAVPAKLLLHKRKSEDSDSALSRDGVHLTVLERPADRLLAEAMGAVAASARDVWSVPEGAHHRSATVAQIIGCQNSRSIAIFGGAALVPLLENLLQYCPAASIIYTLRPALTWQAGGWEWLRATANLAIRHTGRLRLRAAPGAVLGALELLDAPVDRADIKLPAPAIRPPPGPVSLIMPGSSLSIPTCGHVATAAAEIRRIVPTCRILLPRAIPQTLKILERFGAAVGVSVYDDLETLLPALAGSRFIYCRPFADASVDAAALQTLSLGGLVLVAPGPLVYPDSLTQRILEVRNWEDAMHITHHLCEAIAHYDLLVESLCPMVAAAQ
jgi:glycosyltransferase involved in cell wall biosynthesis